MLILAYIVPIAVVAWMLARRRRSWLQPLAPGIQELIRFGLLMLALLGVAGGAWGIGLRLVEEGEEGANAWLALVLFAALALGAALYASGVVVWRGPLALRLRRVGWILVVVALAVPSTLTLALPVAALLVVGLEYVPRHDSPAPFAASA